MISQGPRKSLLTPEAPKPKVSIAKSTLSTAQPEASKPVSLPPVMGQAPNKPSVFQSVMKPVKNFASQFASDVGQGVSGALNLMAEGTKEKLTKTGTFIDDLSAWKGVSEALKETDPQKKQEALSKSASAMAMGPIEEEALGAKAITKGAKDIAPIFQGFEDLSLKTLEKLKGKAVVSKQFIEDLAKTPDLKQAERDLVNNALSTVKGKVVDVQAFANKVKQELLPLKVNDRPNASIMSDRTYRYENITLPSEVRGPIQDYSEHRYESPIPTSAGSVHFGHSAPNYFGHTRVEDLPSIQGPLNVRKNQLESIITDISNIKKENPDAKVMGIHGDTLSVDEARAEARAALHDLNVELQSAPGDTRRVIEVQSDLYQRGRLEGELSKYQQSKYLEDFLPESERNELYKLQSKKEILTKSGVANEFPIEKQRRIDELSSKAERLYKEAPIKREQEIAKLQQYNDPTAHFRMVREEVKRAAQDGKTALQFPTGETAMKVEGLGSTKRWTVPIDSEHPRGQALSMDNIKLGMNVRSDGIDWIVTDILGEGKFKAAPSDEFESLINNDEVLYKRAREKYTDPNTDDFDLDKALKDKGLFKAFADRASESFDISGNVDKDNPIYKFYEKDLGKYLKNKYGAKLVTDPQGVSWYQVDIDPTMAKNPVEAFMAVPFGLGLAGSSEQKKKNQSFQLPTTMRPSTP